MMETADASKTLADTYKATQCHNPEHWNLKAPIMLKHYVMRTILRNYYLLLLIGRNWSHKVCFNLYHPNKAYGGL